MISDSLAPAPILIPLGAAFVLPLLGRLSRALRPLTCIAALVLTLATLLKLSERVFEGQVIVYWMSSWTPRDGFAIGISLSIDAWGMLTALIVAVVGLLTVIYSTAYLRGQTGQGPYYVLIMLLVAGLIGFSLSGDLFNQFVWLEVFSVAAFALTGFHVERRDAIEAAFKYLITNSVASFFIAIGLTLLYMQTGALNLAEVARAFRPSPAGLAAAGLLVGGYATKAALVPWHFWLPDAHAAAPSPVSAFFSGALIKVGIYAVARSALTLFPFQPGSIMQAGLLVVAAASMLLGGIQMTQQHSIKRILAFSSVSQVGYITLGLAIGTPAGFAAAAFHMVSHALIKSALFMGAGAVVWRTGIHRIDEGGGLARKMPVTCALMCLAALGLAGLPFFSGFVSKTMLEESATTAGFPALAWIAVLSSILTFAGLARLLWRVFGQHRVTGPLLTAREAPVMMLLPMVLLVAGSVLVGTLPQWPSAQLAWPASRSLSERERYIALVLEPETAGAAHEPEFEPPPRPYDRRHWGAPLIVVLGGSLLAYRLLHPALAWSPVKPAIHITRNTTRLLRRWHSGLVGDYALWNTFATAVILIALLLAERFNRW